MSLEEGNGRIAASLLALQTAAKTHANQRSEKISLTVDRICTAAYEDGLSSETLDGIIDVLTRPNELDQASMTRLIRSLYPAGRVPDGIIVKVLGSLGHGAVKPGHAVQVLLLKWLVMVYDVLENKRLLSHFYALLFNLLDTVAIRPQLCHVLSLITRRRHVRPFRIQVLMELIRQAGNEPPLVGLMRVYKDYYPDVIVGNVTSGRASVFMHPDPEWRQRLATIQEAHLQDSHDILQRQGGFRVARHRTRAGVTSIVPEVRTSHAQESSITLEEIDTVEDFIQNLEKIELPNQLVAVLGDPLLQKFIQLKSTEAMSHRIDNWLLAFFEDQLAGSGQSGKATVDMLQAIRDYASYAKKLPKACLAYLNSIVPSWDGVTSRDIILDLYTYVPLSSFEGLYSSVLQPLEDAILDDSAESKIILVEFYRNLLQNWATSLLAFPDTPGVAGQAIESLSTHVNSLALATIQSSPTILTHSVILGFYETTAALISNPVLKPVVRITTPPAELVYTMYFTLSISTMSRLCFILALYKRAFELAMALPSESSPVERQTYTKDYVNHFNGFLMDICNCLWRSRAFNTSDTNALGCLMPAPVVTALDAFTSGLGAALSLPSLFSLQFSPLFCLVAATYVRDLEDNMSDDISIRHAGPVTQASLKRLERNGGLKLQWPDYRSGLLRHVEEKGAKGVAELMYNTMKHLRTARGI